MARNSSMDSHDRGSIGSLDAILDASPNASRPNSLEELRSMTQKHAGRPGSFDPLGGSDLMHQNTTTSALDHPHHRDSYSSDAGFPELIQGFWPGGQEGSDSRVNSMDSFPIFSLDKRGSSGSGPRLDAESMMQQLSGAPVPMAQVQQQMQQMNLLHAQQQQKAAQAAQAALQAHALSPHSGLAPQGQAIPYAHSDLPPAPPQHSDQLMLHQQTAQAQAAQMAQAMLQQMAAQVVAQQQLAASSGGGNPDADQEEADDDRKMRRLGEDHHVGSEKQNARRESHKKVEQRRRERAKECFDELKRMLPSSADVKPDKNSILIAVIDYMKELRLKTATSTSSADAASLTTGPTQIQYRSAFQLAKQGMAFAGIDSRFWDVNEALCGMVGYSSSELCAMTFMALTLQEDLEMFLQVGIVQK